MLASYPIPAKILLNESVVIKNIEGCGRDGGQATLGLPAIGHLTAAQQKKN
jgi:hypothetical protein